MVTLDGLGYKFAGWEAAGGIREASGRLAWLSGALKSKGSAQGKGEIFIRGRYYKLQPLLLAATFQSTMLQATGLQAMRLPGLQRIRDYETSRLYRITCCQFDLPLPLSLVAPKGAGGLHKWAPGQIYKGTQHTHLHTLHTCIYTPRSNQQLVFWGAYIT